MSILPVILMYAIWSSIFSLGKMTLAYAPPLFLTSMRMLLGGAILVGFLFLFRKQALKIKRKDLLPLSLLALFSIYLTNAFEFWGLQYLTAAKACFIYSLSPFLAPLFSFLHFGEKMNRKKLIGMGIGFLGFIPILATQSGAEELVGGLLIFSWAELALLAATISSVYGWVLLRLLVKNELSPVTANGISMLIGGLFALIHSFVVEPWTPLPISQGGLTPVLAGVLSMTFVSNILCSNLYGYLLKRFTATFLSFMGLLSPIFASLTGWLLLGETPSLLIFAGTAILSLGLYLVYQAELNQGYIRASAAPKTDPATLNS